MRHHTSNQPKPAYRSTVQEVTPSLIERLTSLDRPAQLALSLFFILIVLDSYHVIGPRSEASSPSERSASAGTYMKSHVNRARQESFISLERTRSGGIGVGSSGAPRRTSDLGNSWLSERYAGRPSRLSAHLMFAQPQGSGRLLHRESASCDALLIHARVALTHGVCAVNLAQSSGLGSAVSANSRTSEVSGASEISRISRISRISVVKSHVDESRSIALHLLSDPLPFIPVQVGVNAQKSAYDEMILKEGLSRYASLGDSILISPSAHYAQYGSFIIRKDTRTFNQLSAVFGERARALNDSDREWISSALQVLTKE